MKCDAMKKALCAVLVLLCLIGSARASVAVNSAGIGLLFDDNGTLLSMPGRYSRVDALADTGLFACTVAESGLIALAGADGIELTGDIYEAAISEGGYLLLCREGKWALADREIDFLSGRDFTRITAAAEGRFVAFRTSLYDDMADSIYLLLPDGRTLPAGVSIRCADGLKYSEGLAPAVSASSGKKGYLDENGNWTVLPKLDFAGDFCLGLAAAGTETGMGLVDIGGLWVLEPFFDSVQLNERYVLTAQGGERVLYVRQEERLIPIALPTCRYASLTGCCAVLYTQDGAQLWNGRGKAADFAPDVTLFPGDEGHVLIAENGEMSIYDVTDGSMAGPYEYVTRLKNSAYYRVCTQTENGFAFGLVDAQGSELIKPVWQTLYAPKPGLIAAGDEQRIWLYSCTDEGCDLLCEYEIGSFDEEFGG